MGCELVCLAEVVGCFLLGLDGGGVGEFFVDEFLYAVGDVEQGGGLGVVVGLEVEGVVGVGVGGLHLFLWPSLIY